MNARRTEFDGRMFRSRGEAKYAAFFLAWGLPYEYEPDRFGPGRIGYLPDFHLPTLRLYLEIKPACQFGREEAGVDRAVRAAAFIPEPLWIAFGEPMPGQYVIQDDEGGYLVLAHCRRCHALSYVLADGQTIEAVWQDAEDGGCGWGEIGKHSCGDHDRHPDPLADDALAAAYRNGREMWRWF